MIRSCTCSCPGQDALHGTGRRVFNPAYAGKLPVWRCSICLATHDRGGIRIAKTKLETGKDRP